MSEFQDLKYVIHRFEKKNDILQSDKLAEESTVIYKQIEAMVK